MFSFLYSINKTVMINPKRKKFYEKSLSLFYEKGFKGTTMRDIANALSCDVANIYNYTDSKQSILERFLFSISKEFHTELDRIISSQYNPAEKLEKVISFYVRLTFSKPLEISLLVNEWRHLTDDKLEQFIRERNEFEKKVSQIITAGIESGIFIHIDINLATHLFLSSLRLLFDRYTFLDKSVNPLEVERQIGKYILRGILSNPG